MSPTIRLAGTDDRTAVEAVVMSAYAPYVARIGRKPAPMLDDYDALIRENRVYVVEDGAAIQGILVLIPEEGATLLDNVAIRPDAQGLGHGRRLMEFAERTARVAGYEAITLYTNEAMTENIALYSRIGFVETHRAEEMGLRRVFMTKRLA